MQEKVQNIDTILTEIGLGKFQIVNFVIISIAVIVTNMTCTTFVFTARDTAYRCYVPECDVTPDEYDRAWLSSAIPYENSVIEKCERFSLRNVTINNTLLQSYGDDKCVPQIFDNSSTKQCDQWVYGEGASIVKEFNMPCENWKSSLVGSMNGAGQLVSLLFSGVLSDTYGRRTIMGIMAAATGVLGLIQSFSVNYWMFIVFEFLTVGFSAGAYSSTYVYAMETLPSQCRDGVSAIINISHVSGYLIAGILAWMLPTWRYLLLAANAPCLLVLLAYFTIPESIRWLNAKGRKAKCAKILKKAAAINGIKFSNDNLREIEKMESFVDLKQSTHKIEANANNIEDTKTELSLHDIFKTPPLLQRLIICAFCWFSNIFVYYGLYLNSVALSGNPYLNFIFSTLVEYPALIGYLLLLRCFGRKYSVFSTFLCSGLACIIYAFAPNMEGIIGLIVYLISKLFITMSIMIVYLYSTELFPTSLRNSVMSFCSVFGRIGGILAPQVPLLLKIHPSLPMSIYGIISIISAFTLLKLPETSNIKLPDTVNDAVLMK